MRRSMIVVLGAFGAVVVYIIAFVAFVGTVL